MSDVEQASALPPTVVLHGVMGGGDVDRRAVRLIVSRYDDGGTRIEAEYLEADGLGADRWSRAAEHPGMAGLAERLLSELLLRDAEDRGPIAKTTARTGGAGPLIEVDLGEVSW